VRTHALPLQLCGWLGELIISTKWLVCSLFSPESQVQILPSVAIFLPPFSKRSKWRLQSARKMPDAKLSWNFIVVAGSECPGEGGPGWLYLSTRWHNFAVVRSETFLVVEFLNCRLMVSLAISWQLSALHSSCIGFAHQKAPCTVMGQRRTGSDLLQHWPSCIPSADFACFSAVCSASAPFCNAAKSWRLGATLRMIVLSQQVSLIKFRLQWGRRFWPPPPYLLSRYTFLN